MRTTIEIHGGQRARLLELAARRGLKGFSSIVREAIDLYLGREAERERRTLALRSLRGCLSDEEGEEMLRVVDRLRSEPSRRVDLDGGGG